MNTLGQYASYLWIHELPSGREFDLSGLCGFLEARYPEQCSRASRDARWGVDRASREGLIEAASGRGEYRRADDRSLLRRSAADRARRPRQR